MSITATFNAADFNQAVDRVSSLLEDAVAESLELTLQAVAARAKLNAAASFTDRTGNLRNSIMSDGVTGSLKAGTLIGVIGFAATSKAGYFYGLAQEFGTRTGVRAKWFIRSALDAQDGEIIEDAMANAFTEAGFEVTR